MTPDQQEALAALWRRYKTAPTLEDREALILAYVPLVRYTALRMAQQLHSSLEQQDLVSYGIFGLIDAIEKYDLDRPVKFETNAINRIRGAILDELRAQDWAPRSLRSKARSVEKAMSDLEHQLGRTPTPEEVSTHVGMSLEDFQLFTMELRTSWVDSLDRTVGGADESTTSVGERIMASEDVELPSELSDAVDLLAEGVQQLTDNDRIMLTLYYYEGCTLKEIAAVLEVSESRVSQIHTRAMVSLQRRLAAQG